MRLGSIVVVSVSFKTMPQGGSPCTKFSACSLHAGMASLLCRRQPFSSNWLKIKKNAACCSVVVARLDSPCRYANQVHMAWWHIWNLKRERELVWTCWEETKIFKIFAQGILKIIIRPLRADVHYITEQDAQYLHFSLSKLESQLVN